MGLPSPILLLRRCAKLLLRDLGCQCVDRLLPLLRLRIGVFGETEPLLAQLGVHQRCCTDLRVWCRR